MPTNKICKVCEFSEEEVKEYCPEDKGFPVSYGDLCSVCKNGRSRYGLNRREQLELLASQDNKCKICKTEVKLHQGRGKVSGQIDHTPGTGRGSRGPGTGKPADVRGVLCFTCNKNLSDSNITWLKAAVKYLEEHGEKNG